MEWTKYDIAARFAPIGWVGWGDCYNEKLKREWQIRKLIFGTGDLLELGKLWNIKGCRDKPKKKTNTKNLHKDAKHKKTKGKGQIK